MVLTSSAAFELAAWTASVRRYGRPVRAATLLDRIAMFAPITFAVSLGIVGFEPTILAATIALGATAYIEQRFIIWLLPAPAPRIRSVFDAWRAALGGTVR